MRTRESFVCATIYARAITLFEMYDIYYTTRRDVLKPPPVHVSCYKLIGYNFDRAAFVFYPLRNVLSAEGRFDRRSARTWRNKKNPHEARTRQASWSNRTDFT